MAAPSIELTALDLRMMRLAQYGDRRRRVTQHAVEAMRDMIQTAGLSAEAHGYERIGNLVDELVHDADEAGLAEKWVDRGNRKVPDTPLDGFPITFEGVKGYAICLPNDHGDTRSEKPWTIVNILPPEEYKRSTESRWRRRDGAARVSDFGAKLVAAKIKPAPPPVGTDAVIAAAAEAVRQPAPPPLEIVRSVDDTLIGTAPGPAPAPKTRAPTIPQETASLTSAQASSLDTGGALILFESPSAAPKEIACPWEDVPKQIAQLVEHGIDPETIQLYRRVPFQVRKTVTVNVGG